MLTNVEEYAVRLLKCPYCWSTPGDLCITARSGRVARPHKARTKPLLELWAKAYREGERDVCTMALSLYEVRSPEEGLRYLTQILAFLDQEEP